MKKSICVVILLLQIGISNDRTPTELNIEVIGNDIPLNVLINVTAQGNIYDENQDLTQLYQNAQTSSTETTINFRGDHVRSQTGGDFIFGYGMYKIHLTAYSINLYIYVDFTDCNYLYGVGLTSDMNVQFNVSMESIGISYSGQEYTTVTNGHIEHIWDQDNGPTPDTYCFSVTPVDGLDVGNSNNHPHLTWTSSGEGITYDIWKANDGGNASMIVNNYSSTSYTDQLIQLCCGYERHEHCYDVYANYLGDTPGNYESICIISKSNTASKEVVVKNRNDFLISNVYPNPFNNIVKYYFNIITSSSDITFAVYNIMGKVVYRENIGYLLSGSYHVKWNANNYSSGVYFLSIQSKDNISMERVILLK